MKSNQLLTTIEIYDRVRAKFCCKNFASRRGNKIVCFYDARSGEPIINYYPMDRMYSTIHGKEIGYDIQYCPWCGKQLPNRVI